MVRKIVGGPRYLQNADAHLDLGTKLVKQEIQSMLKKVKKKHSAYKKANVIWSISFIPC